MYVCVCDWGGHLHFSKQRIRPYPSSVTKEANKCLKMYNFPERLGMFNFRKMSYLSNCIRIHQEIQFNFLRTKQKTKASYHATWLISLSASECLCHSKWLFCKYLLSELHYQCLCLLYFIMSFWTSCLRSFLPPTWDTHSTPI